MEHNHFLLTKMTVLSFIIAKVTTKHGYHNTDYFLAVTGIVVEQLGLDCSQIINFSQL